MCEDKSIWMHGGGLTALVTDLNTIWLNVIILIIIIPYLFDYKPSDFYTN